MEETEPLSSDSNVKAPPSLEGLLLVLAVCWSMSPAPAASHGAVHEQIVELTARIEADPNNATLYLKRGELYQSERHWDDALANYDRAIELAPDLAKADFARSATLLEAGRPKQALDAIDRYVRKKPEDSAGHFLRGQIRVQLGRHGKAVADFTRAIENRAHGARPNPEYFIQRARAMADGGLDLSEAVRGLDDGMALLGPLVTLQLLALDLERQLQRFDAALSRVDQLATRSPRKESWWLLRGEILDQAGRPRAARAAYVQALAAIELLPPGHRGTKGILALETRARAALHNVDHRSGDLPTQ